MNKETLSHYGWVVILTLVLSVLMAFATPLGTYVGDGVVAIGQTFVKTAVNSADEGNVSKLENEIDDKFKGCNHTNVDIINKVEPACGIDGYTGDKVCRKCGKELEKGVEIISKDHDFTHYMKFSDDQHRRICNNCDYEEITNHRLNYVETVKSTCITAGSSDVDCKDCQYTGVRPNALIPDNHEGKSTYGGTQAVHLKYSCCGATINNSHSYTKTVKIAATCVEKGTSTYTCACGYKYDSQDIPFGGHDFSVKDTSNTYRVSTATCQALAVYNYKCSRCSEKGTNTYTAGSYASHNYTVKDTSSTYLKTSATCLDAATYYYKCTWCTAKGTSYYSSGSATGHSFVNAGNTVVTSATCQKNKVCYKSCQWCGIDTTTTYEVPNSKVACSYTADGPTVATAATCTTNKYCFKECKWCGADSTTKYEVANSKNASNHSGSSTYGGTSGVHTKYSCCGVTISTSHTYDQNSGVQYTAATCTAKRKNYKSCVCGYNPKSSSYVVETGSVNSSNHTGSSVYGGTSGVHTKYNCCGATISSSHSYSVDSGVQYTAATCTTARKNYKKCACGYNPQSSSYVVSTGSVNSSNHTGSSVYGGTSGVHTKYSCCGATISSSHSYSKTASDSVCRSCACGYKDTAHGTRTTTTQYNTSRSQQRTASTCGDCGHVSYGSWTTNSCSHSFTGKCDTKHTHNKTVQNFLDSSSTWSCSYHGIYTSSSSASTKICPHRHIMCISCGINQKGKGCHATWSGYTQKACVCGTSHGSYWRCSNEWCRTYYRNGSISVSSGTW